LQRERLTQKTLLASASLSLALLFSPLGSLGPITILGSAGRSPAHAIEIGGDEDEGGVGILVAAMTMMARVRGKRVVENAGFRRVQVRIAKGGTSATRAASGATLSRSA